MHSQALREQMERIRLESQSDGSRTCGMLHPEQVREHANTVRHVCPRTHTRDEVQQAVQGQFPRAANLPAR